MGKFFHVFLIVLYIFGCKTELFSFQTIPKISRYLGLLRKDKTPNIANFHGTDLVTFNHSRGGKTLSCSQINMVTGKKHGSALIHLKSCIA